MPQANVAGCFSVIAIVVGVILLIISFACALDDDQKS
jgi:hypothetical protein